MNRLDYSILEACVARAHAAAVHEQAKKGRALPDFSPELAMERRDRAEAKRKAAWAENLKAKGAHE